MKLLVASPIDPDALHHLQTRHDVITAYGAPEDELRRLAADRQILIFRSGVEVTRSVMENAPELRMLVRAGSGLDNLDIAYTQSRGIALERIPGPGARAVAEMTFALMLALARRIVEADTLLRQGRWAKSELTGQLLQGKTLGIVGLGNIGGQVARLGLAWNMSVIGCVDQPSSERGSAFSVAGIVLANCDEVVAQADFLTVHVPLQESTRNLIDAATIARMKRGAFLINVARGGVVDENALYEDLLGNNHLAGAALDVHVREGEGKISPLASLSNIVLTPHIGAATVDSQRQIGEEVVRIIDEATRSIEAPRR